MNSVEAITNIYMLLYVIINLILIITIRKLSHRIGGKPPGLHLYTFLQYVHHQSGQPNGRILKYWLITFYTLNAIGFTALIVLFAVWEGA